MKSTGRCGRPQHNIFNLYTDIPQPGAEPHPQTARSSRRVSVCIVHINGMCFKKLLTSEHTLGVRDKIVLVHSGPLPTYLLQWKSLHCEPHISCTKTNSICINARDFTLCMHARTVCSHTSKRPWSSPKNFRFRHC